MATLRLSKRLTNLWWLHPAWLFAAIIGLTVLAAVVQSDAAYQLYRTPKYLGVEHLWIAGLAIACFAFGSLAGERTGRIPGNTTVPLGLVRTWFWLAISLTIFGYAVWFAMSVRNGFSLAALQGLFSLQDDASSLNEDVFQRVPGVTSCTQFGPGAMLLGCWLYLHGERSVRWPLVLLIFLGTCRALLYSERLALIELLVPMAIILLRGKVLGQPATQLVRWALRLAPAMGLVGLLTFFGAFEYFRSWRFYQNSFDSYPEFVVWRVSGYYTTAHNNGAMGLAIHDQWPLPYTILRNLWEFPGVSSSPLAYDKLTGIDPGKTHTRMLELYGNPELNNDGGLFQPFFDFGLPGGLALWCVYGFLAGRLYRGYMVGSFAGLTLYPIILLSILEVPRLLYLCYTRAFPTLVLLVVVGWLVRRASLQARPETAHADSQLVAGSA